MSSYLDAECCHPDCGPRDFLLFCNWSASANKGVFEHGANTCHFMCNRRVKRHLVVSVDIADYPAVAKLKLSFLKKRVWALEIYVQGV